jgi:hypothetical protein
MRVTMTKYFRFRDLVAQGRYNNRMTLKRAIDAGRFPKPVHLGPNTVAWTDEMLAEHDARLLAERDAPKAA